MKICPICSTIYNDEEMRFCIRDGGLLTETDAVPQVQSLDEIGEQEEATIVSPNQHAGAGFTPPNKIVIDPGEPHPQALPPIAVAPSPGAQQPAAQKSFPVLPVVLATLGVLALFGAAAVIGGWYYLTGGGGGQIAAVNANSNQADSNSAGNNSLSVSDLGANTVFDSNANLNANTDSPSPTPKPSPSPSPRLSPSPSPRLSPTPDESNSNRPGVPTIISGTSSNTNSAVNTAASPRGVVTPTPRPNVPTTVSGGVVNGRATRLITPGYPPAARAMRASGQVQVQVTIDESGNVISANAITGHPLLRQAAASAARQSKFSPTVLSGQPVKVNGVIVYNFNPQ